MARLLTYTMLLAGVMALLNLAGITTTIGYLISWIGFNPNLGAWAIIFGAIGLYSLTQVLPGIIGFTVPESAIIGGFATTIAGLAVSDFLIIRNILSSSCGVSGMCSPFTTMITYIIGLLLVGYIIVLIQWWRGNDIL